MSRDLIVGTVAIALDHPMCALEEPRSHLARTTGIVVKEDDPLARGTCDPHPHPVRRTRRLLAVDHLYRRLIDADVTAAAEPLIHQVDQRLDSLPERDNPGGLRGPGKIDPVACADRLQAIQRQRIDILAGDQVGKQPRCRIRSGQDLRR